MTTRHLADAGPRSCAARPRWSGGLSPGRRRGRSRPFDVDGRQRRHHAHPEPRRQPRDVVQRLDDVRRARGAGLVVRRVGHRDPADAAQERQEVGQVEDGRDRLAPARLAHEGEVADRQPVEVGRRGRPAGAAARGRRRVHAEPSTTSRSVRLEQLARAAPLASGGSPGHQTVTGRSWIEQRRHQRRQVPARLAARGQEDQLGARLGRVGARQHAVRLDPRVEPRRAVRVRARHDQRPRRVPAGEPADRLGALRSPISGWRATTTRFITLRPRRDVPAAGRRLAVAVDVDDRRAGAQIRLSSVSMPSIEFARDVQRSVGSPGRGGPRARSRPPVGRVDRPPGSLRSAPWASPVPSLRSAATGGPRARAGRRPPRAPRCRHRSSGSRAAGVVGPGVEDRVHDRPRLLDLVGAGEQRRVAEQRVEDQRLVRVGRVDRERRAVREVHGHVADVDAQARDLGAEPQQDPLVGLDAHREQVRLGIASRCPGTAGAGPP